MRSNAANWGDSRKRSRFTNGAVAVSAIPLREIRQLLDDLQVAAELESSTPDVARDSNDPTEAGSLPAVWPHARERLTEIQAAQKRVADGTYGTCFGCGWPIPVSRLRAMPCSRFCAECDRQVPVGSAHQVEIVARQEHEPIT